MRKSEPVDEFAETQVLLGSSERTADRDSDALSLYAEYERELALESRPRQTKHTSR